VYGTGARDAFAAVGVTTKVEYIGRLHPASMVLDKHQSAFTTVMEMFGDSQPRKKKIILVATSGIDPQEEDWIDTVVRLCADRGDAIVVVKPHPSLAASQVSALEGLRRRLGPRENAVLGICDGQENGEALVAIAGLCITDCSGIGIEAVLLNKPLLVVNRLGISYQSNDFAALGVAELTTDSDELRDAIERALDGSWKRPEKAKRAFVEAFNKYDDQDAAGRLCRLITG